MAHGATRASQTPDQAIDAWWLALSRADETFYLDPSAEGKATATKDVIAAMSGIRRCDIVEAKGVTAGGIFGEFGEETISFAPFERSLLFPEIRRLGTFFRERCKSYEPAYLRFFHVRFVDFAFNDRPFRSESEQAEDRRKNLGVSDQTTSLFAERDPRKWDLSVLVQAVIEAREDQTVLDLGSWETRGCEKKRWPDFLSKMGAANASRLIFGSRDFAPTPAQIDFALNDYHRHCFFEPLRHFALEGSLYEREWERRPLDSNSTTDWPRRGGQTLSEYSAYRWKETDAAAPHPDLRKLDVALRHSNERN